VGHCGIFLLQTKKKKLVTMSARIKFSAPTIIIHGHCGIFLLGQKKKKAGYHGCTDKIQRAIDNHVNSKTIEMKRGDTAYC